MRFTGAKFSLSLFAHQHTAEQLWRDDPSVVAGSPGNSASVCRRFSTRAADTVEFFTSTSARLWCAFEEWPSAKRKDPTQFPLPELRRVKEFPPRWGEGGLVFVVAFPLLLRLFREHTGHFFMFVTGAVGTGDTFAHTRRNGAPCFSSPAQIFLLNQISLAMV